MGAVVVDRGSEGEWEKRDFVGETERGGFGRGGRIVEDRNVSEEFEGLRILSRLAFEERLVVG